MYDSYRIAYNYLLDGNAEYYKDRFTVSIAGPGATKPGEIYLITPIISIRNDNWEELIEEYRRYYVITIDMYEEYYKEEVKQAVGLK